MSRKLVISFPQLREALNLRDDVKIWTIKINPNDKSIELSVDSPTFSDVVTLEQCQ